MLYNVKVEFHSDFVKVIDNEILIGINKKPIKGEANKEIVKKLAKHFGVSSSSVRIRSGLKSSSKTVEILS